jgi:hypothetical protein
MEHPDDHCSYACPYYLNFVCPEIKLISIIVAGKGYMPNS